MNQSELAATSVMEHLHFEDLISDYLDHNLDRPTRRFFAEHLLACRPCHQIFNDVRAAVEACHDLRAAQMPQLPMQMAAVEQRILNATTAGEMLSCRALDALISDYFDGVIESSYERIFHEHFAVCESCGRLSAGVRESLEEPSPIEVPAQLHDRIFAATTRARCA